MKLFRGIQITGLHSTLTGITAILLALALLPSAAFCGGVVSTPTEAALNAALAGGGTVTFACDGTITVTSTKNITTTTVLDASGHSIKIDGSHSVQLFTVSSGATLTLTNLWLANGFTTTNGAAIYNNGTVSAYNCKFDNNLATGTNGDNGANGNNSTANFGGAGQNGGDGGSVYGAAIYSMGTLNLTTCEFVNNEAKGGTGGSGGNGGHGLEQGGNGGNGGAGGIARGGAIFTTNNVTITDCNIHYNIALAGNGGSGGSGGSGGYGGSYPGNSGFGSVGGEASGAGIYSVGSSQIIGSTFQSDIAQGGTSGADGVTNARQYGYTGQTGGSSYGGGLCNLGTNWTVNCTFSLSHTWGGNGGAGSGGYVGGQGGNGGSGFGGGIYNAGSSATTNCTFSACGAYVGQGGAYGPDRGGGHYGNGSSGSSYGGNVANTGGTFTLKNSIFVYGSYNINGIGTFGPNGYGSFFDSGNNISSDSSIGLTATNSHNNLDPLLVGSVYGIANNGGFTPTCALSPNSPAIGAGDSTAAPFTDQRGYLRTDKSDIGAYEYSVWTPVFFAAGPTASLDGNVGLFFFDRLTTNWTTSPLTLNFTIGGTASNGVDYTAISNSVTIPAGARYVNLPIRGIPDAFNGTNKTVVLTLTSGANFQILTNSGSPNMATVTLFDHNTYNSASRFVRGSSTAPDFQSLVVPLDYETGVPLAAIGGNATNLFPGNPWTTNFYHYNATNNTAIQTNIAGRIVFQNPIVAFGDTVGGSPLYLNHSYSFGVASATPSTEPTALRIQVYYRSNSMYAGTINLPIPDMADTNQLTQWVANGFTVATSGFGLQTTMFSSDSMDFGLLFGADYRLTHNASSTATNYYYVVEEQSGGIFNNVVLNQAGLPDWSKLYVMEFSPYPANLSTFIDQPHFDGKPLPPAYQGMSLAELTNVAPMLPNLSYLNPSNYLAIDGSPELRRHPILDQFVQNMGNDPLALANYVQNEIGLVDAIDYDTNYNSQPSVNLGGVNRSALAAFEEGEGSPLEQCELLVYLLRQAGVPAAYVFPTNGGLQMLDFQLSKLLQIQVHGAMNPYGQTNMPTLINVNYPWVAAYIGTNWVQIFPWLKDTEITEGLNFYDYMPTNYNSGYKWMRAFLAGDTNIFSLSSSDQPLDLLPAFIQHELNLNHYGLSVDDMGVQIVNRRHLYSQWSQFPKPFALSGTPLVIESLKTNLNLFNTIEIQAYSVNNPNRMVDTTEMRVADLFNRMLLLKFVQVGSNLHDMILTLEAYSPDITNETTFGTNADPTWKLSATNLLDSTDDQIAVRIIHKRDRFLPADYTGADALSVSNLWGYDYFETTPQLQTYTTTDAVFRKGDWAALCLDIGKVTQRMLNVHAQEIWQFNQTANTNQPSTLDPDIYVGQAIYLLGMSYWNYLDRFNELNDRLHKIHVVSSFAHGFGIMRPKRDSSGALPNNGTITLITPAVHMVINGMASVFNGSLRPDSGYTYGTLSRLNWWLMGGLQASAAEHGVLRSFYQTNALSSVTLLEKVGTNMVDLNSGNYLAVGETMYNGVKFKNADTNLWNKITSFFANGDPEEEAFATPGIVTNGTYIGTGAILFNAGDFEAPVGGFNGGFADFLPDSTFSSVNSPNITVAPSPDGSIAPFQLLTTPSADVSGNYGNLVNGATAAWQQSATYDSLFGGQTQLDPALAGAEAQLNINYGSAQNAPGAYSQLYDIGAASTETAAYNDQTQRIAEPVNLMTGEFYIDADDITLPGPMPLQIRRNYGSQNLAENEFGFGWKISYVPFLSVGTNSTLIYAAEMDGTMVAYHQTATNANVWLPQPADNPTLNNNSTIGIGSIGNLFNNRLQLSVVNGTNTYTLTGADGSTRTFSEASYPIGSFDRQRPYLNKWQDGKGNFYTFQYGTDSTQPDYGEVNRIQSSNGNFVWFEYDVYGHIIAAHTGDGRILNYTYDQYGDLVSVVLPDQMEIDYVYQHSNYVTNGLTNVYSTHLIVEEDKPDGRVLQNMYDSQRRVTSQLTTAGVDLNPVRTATFTYTNNFNLSSPTNLLTGVTVISDYFNHTTTYYYTNSLVRKIVDPLNQTILQDWYETNTPGGFQRSLKSVTDKRGLETAYFYDSQGNLTNTIITGDLTGDGITTQTATNTAIYNTNNLPLKITDAFGNSKTIVYDPVFAFLPQQIVTSAGATPVGTNYLVYGDATNVVVNGNTTQTNKAFGLLTRRIRAYGSPDAATNDMAYDGHGFLTESIRYTGDSDPNVTNYFFYNERGDRVFDEDALGAYTYSDYDPMDRLTEKEYVDENGNLLSWDFCYYNANGELNWVDGPRYNPEDYIFYDHDGMGRVTTEIHWRSEAKANGTGVEAPAGYNLYAQTFNQFDPLGDLVSRIDPRGAITTNKYDALTRLVETTHLDTDGTTVLSTEGYGYEPGGQVKYFTNALGGVTTTLYTSTGKPEYRSNPDGSTNAWRYYLDGRIKKHIQRNGAYWLTTYDDVNRITTRVFYSAANVPEATNSTQLDQRGNVIARVDADNNVFTNTYDGLDRVKVTAGPPIVTVSSYQEGNPPSGPLIYATNVLQQISTNFYDAAGRSVTNINALGEMTATTFDAIQRETSKKIYNADGTLARETYHVYSPDHNSVTTTNGSSSSAIVTTIYTDNGNRKVLSVAYPSSGVLDYTLKHFDLAGNLDHQEHDTSASGSTTQWTFAYYTHDGLNRVTSQEDRDGAQTYLAYDSMNDLTNRTMPGGLQWQATYNNAGQVLQDRLVGSDSSVTRSDTYTYYPGGSPFAGLLDTKTNGRGLVSTHSYDDWLRPTSITRTLAFNTSIPPIQMLYPPPPATTNTFPSYDYNHLDTFYSYDVRGFATNITEQYTGSANGPDPKVVSRTYDPYGQLASESITINGVPFSSASQTWDATGRRTGLSINGANYNFGWNADHNLTYAADPTGSGGYTFDTAGLLTTRAVGSKTTTITSRDGEGRPYSIVTDIGATAELTESLSYYGDGLLAYDTLYRGDFTDSRVYGYANLSRRLTYEQLNLDGSTTWTNQFTYDKGVQYGPGVLTQMGVPNSNSADWSAAVSSFSRVDTETNTAVSYPAYGRLNGQATLTAFLDNEPLSTSINSTGDTNWPYQWSAQMELAPGAHQLKVAALHPSGFYTAYATNSFTNNFAYERDSIGHDGSGNVVTREWLNPSGVATRFQWLYYDTENRLIMVFDYFDNNLNGVYWRAEYDGLGRRLLTECYPLANGVIPNGAHPTIINQYYDPQAEFLELGVSVNNAQTQWKLYGPDLDGTYGGQNGTGGFDGVSPYLNTFNPVISDSRGDILAEVTNGVVAWNPARPTGYGAVPGHRPPSLGHGADLAQASAWRGHWPDITGYYNLGMRLYDPVAGIWLSYDSTWNQQDPNYLTFSGDDPINSFDSDGRASGFLAAPPPWQSQPGQNVGFFQALAPVAASAGGARPITGTTVGDIVHVQQPFYTVALPALQMEYSYSLGVLTGPVGGGTEGSITWGSVGFAALRSAAVNGAASGTVAGVSGEPVGPAVFGGITTGLATGAGGEVASAFGPVLSMSMNAGSGFVGNFAGSSVEQYADTGSVKLGTSLSSGVFGAVMNTGEGNVMGSVERALPKDVAESLTYKVPSEYLVGVGDTSLESWLTPPESGGAQDFLNVSLSYGLQPNVAYTPGPRGGKH